MGTIPLLLEMQQDPDGLPQLSSCLGAFVRTNNEALYGSVTPDSSVDFSKGVAITSILHTSEHSHVEPVRYGAGSGFFRLLALPLAPGRNMAQRITAALAGFLRQPWRWLRVLFALDWARHTQVLLYMQTLEGTLSLALGRDWRRAFARGLVSRVDDPAQAPQAFMPEANDLIQRFTKKVGGVAMSLAPELLLGVPSTAHILGGACMGQTAAEGVIDDKHRVHGWICSERHSRRQSRADHHRSRRAGHQPDSGQGQARPRGFLRGSRLVLVGYADPASGEVV